MQDRVSLYPGRVTLTHVSGQANTFDLTRADQPTQEGTPLNKASLLKDDTAALFGKTNAAVPDEIFSLLSKSVIAHETKITDVLGNLISIPADQIKDGVKIETGSYVGTGSYGSINPNTLTFEFVPKIVFIGEEGTLAGYAIFPYVWGGKYIYLQSHGTTFYNNVSIGGNTMTWYSPNGSASYQLNTNGTVYNYIAIG